MFSAATYLKRRDLLRKSVGNGIILLLGNEESPMNYTDNTYHFRQDSTFLYFLGLNFAGIAAVLDCETGEDIVYGNDLTVEDFVWMGPQPTIAERAKAAGITRTAPLPALVKALRTTEDKGRRIHFLPPYRPENKIKLFELIGILPSETKAESSPELIMAVVEQRNHKSEEEIAEIEKAVNISVDMHLAAMRMARPGVLESEITAACHAIAIAAGGDIAFPIIATINGQTLHNHFHGNTLKSGQMFLADMGAETAMGYCGDLSSTVPVDPHFTSRQRDIYEIALASHNKAIEMLRPGIPFREVYLESARVIVRGLKDMQLMKGNVDDAVEAGAHALFFPCGLGHMMGLDVHDMEDLGEVYVGWAGNPKPTQFGIKSLRLGRPLEPGFVFTIEPGIYFIPELIDQWKASGHNKEFLSFDRIKEYRTFGGIRNEENYLVTETGSRLLGKPKPKSVADVEKEHSKGMPL
ncbi:MAG TPA: aminopeptidase P family protein [Bacteroidales bacterium]|nr:aminopeptidase P family protein [Bacteroidales bacterium]